MGQPLVSVIMPVYNAAAYLDESIESILDQVYRSIELILVDDCSQDASLDICQKWEKKDSRVRVIGLDENIGAGYARNEGIEAARGVYLTFVDADDYIERDMLYNAVKSAARFDLDWVVWGVLEEHYNKQGDKIRERRIAPAEQILQEQEQARKALITLEEHTLFGYQWNKLYKTVIIKENHIRFEKAVLYEDFFFNIEYAGRMESLGILAQAGYHYKKRNTESITAQFVPEYYELSRRRVAKMYRLYQEWEMVDSKMIDILGNIYMRYILSALMRNCDREARMSGKERRAWIRALYSDPLYEELCGKRGVGNMIYRTLQWLIRHRWTWLIQGCGRIVYLGKEGFPEIFGRLKSR